VQNSLIGHAAYGDSAAFVHVEEKWARVVAADHQPVLQCVSRPIGGVPQAIFPALGTSDRQFAGFEVVVVDIQPHDFGTP